MTVRKFLKLYNHYKNNCDLEFKMHAKGLTYAKLEEVAMQEEEWF